MKKLLKLYEERTLSAEIGKVGAYNYQRMVISATETNGTHVFKITRYSNRGYEADTTNELESVLEAMKAFTPKAAAWKVSRKPKAIKPANVKVEKVAPVVSANVKGRR